MLCSQSSKRSTNSMAEAGSVAQAVSSSDALAARHISHLALCLLGVLLLLLLPYTSVAQEIVSVSGCVDVSPATVNCSWSSRLRLETRGLRPPPPYVPCSVLISGNGLTSSAQPPWTHPTAATAATSAS